MRNWLKDKLEDKSRFVVYEELTGGLGNVYFLSTITIAPRLMHYIKLLGCFVSDEFLKKIYSESIDAHLERAAQQVAMQRLTASVAIISNGFL